MAPRVPEHEMLRNKVLISLNDEQYEMLLEESRSRNLAPSIVARLAFVQGLPVIRGKRRPTGRECSHARRNTKGEMA